MFLLLLPSPCQSLQRGSLAVTSHPIQLSSLSGDRQGALSELALKSLISSALTAVAV